MKTLRTILGLVAIEDMELVQMDVKIAFFHEDLDEYVYMQQTEEFIQEDVRCQELVSGVSSFGSCLVRGARGGACGGARGEVALGNCGSLEMMVVLEKKDLLNSKVLRNKSQR
ncbi:hypothetical protein L7F22_013615 [Adiantum nelumboides]|nr:hypothetical protein [Adiantum nelumboides]